MQNRLQLGDIRVEIVRKAIRNIHLSVHPPYGRVRIAVPRHLSHDSIRAFAISKLSWIRAQQRKLLEQERETPRELLDRESHYVWGKRYLLKVVEHDKPPAVSLTPRQLRLQVRPGMSFERRTDLLEDWYRGLVRDAAPAMIARWEQTLAVKVRRHFVQRMKTKWGSCNPVSRTIRLNTDLATKPVECLEYIVVHEMVHLLAPTHNTRFVSIMDSVLPDWHSRRDTLNRLPLRHEKWDY